MGPTASPIHENEMSCTYNLFILLSIVEESWSEYRCVHYDGIIDVACTLLRYNWYTFFNLTLTPSLISIHLHFIWNSTLKVQSININNFSRFGLNNFVREWISIQMFYRKLQKWLFSLCMGCKIINLQETLG